MFRARMARKLARKYPRQGTIIFHSCFTLWSALPLLADVKSAFRYAYHTLINPSKLGSQASKEGFPKETYHYIISYFNNEGVAAECPDFS